MSPMGGRPYWGVLEQLKHLQKEITSSQIGLPILFHPPPFLGVLLDPRSNKGNKPYPLAPLPMSRAFGRVPAGEADLGTP